MDANELSARLPPSRDDEPPSLRQDILDELADHLACAKHREMLTTNDEAKAEQRVLDKFGDPREVARKLWFQAMWSRIMSQRWLLSGMGVLVAICLCLTGTVLWQMQHQRAAMAEQQRLIADTLERLTRLSETKLNEAPQPLPSLKIKLTLDKPDGPPAVGYDVTLMNGSGNQNLVAGESDADGVVDLGYFEPGLYSVVIVANWKTDRGCHCPSFRPIIFHPGKALIEHIVCPSQPTEVAVSLVVELPDDLKKRGVIALVRTRSSTIDCDGKKWEVKCEWTGALVRADGSESVQEGLNRQEMIHYPNESGSSRYRGGRPGIRLEPVTEPKSSGVKVFSGVRYWNTLKLVLEADPRLGSIIFANTEPTGRLFECIPTRKTTLSGQLNNENSFSLQTEFVAEADKPNQWTIQVPDELIEQARAYLKEHPGATSDEPAK